MIGVQLGVPVLLYGELAGGRTRAQLRRGGIAELTHRMGGDASGFGAPPPAATRPAQYGRLTPDFGPPRRTPAPASRWSRPPAAGRLQRGARPARRAGDGPGDRREDPRGRRGGPAERARPGPAAGDPRGPRPGVAEHRRPGRHAAHSRACRDRAARGSRRRRSSGWCRARLSPACRPTWTSAPSIRSGTCSSGPSPLKRAQTWRISGLRATAVTRL